MLPSASVVDQVTVVVPTGNPPNGALLVITRVESSSTRSVAVAVAVPSSPGVSIVSVALASIPGTSAGAVTVGAVLSVMVTDWVAVPVLPSESIDV